MFLSLGIASFLSLGVSTRSSSNNVNDSFFKEEIIALREKYSETYLTNRGTYVAFYYGCPTLDMSNENILFAQIGNYGSSYIRGKSIEVGSTVVNNSLMVGESQIINPLNDQNPEYKTVFELSLPNIDLNYYSIRDAIRDAGFVFKKQSGQLSYASAYAVASPSYDSINGLSIISKSFISSVSLNANYSFLNITDDVIDSLNSSESVLTILLQGTANNQMCYLYGTNNVQYAPYFYIEYDNYGSAREYYENSTTNCMGYALYSNTQLIFTDYIPSNSNFFTTNLESNPSYAINIISYVLSCCMCDNVQYLPQYNSLIESTQRRISVRFLLDNDGKYAGDFHFMWQTKSGDWAVKPGTGECNVYYGEDAPNYDNNWRRTLNEIYNSQTYYFAIEKD